METYHSIIHTIALTMGLAWASGINLYATIAMLGLLGATGNLELPGGLEILQHPAVIMAACVMYVVEFFADKVPGVDTGWDAFHTFVRIPAGAVLAAEAIGDVHPAAEIAAAILGGGISATSHFTKAGSRVLINTSPEPFSNWAASLAEDLVVIGGLWVALNHPWVFLVLFVAFLALAVWLMPKLWRGIRRVFAAIARFFRGELGRGAPTPSTPA